MQGPVPQPSRRFEVDRSALDTAAALRGAAAMLAGVAGLWLLAVAQAWVPRALALAGLVFAFFWGRAQWRHLRTRERVSGYLELAPATLVISDGSATRHIALADVRSVEVDDDRLEVLLQLASGEALRVEPQYRGVGLHELARLLHEAASRARAGASH
jgi:hypothetical protein